MPTLVSLLTGEVTRADGVSGMNASFHIQIFLMRKLFDDQVVLVHCHLSSLNEVQPCSFTAVISYVAVVLLCYVLGHVGYLGFKDEPTITQDWIEFVGHVMLTAGL